MSEKKTYRLNRTSHLSVKEERIGRAVVQAAFHVHKTLGPGLLERVYEVCFCHVLTKGGFSVHRQLNVPIVFENSCFLNHEGAMTRRCTKALLKNLPMETNYLISQKPRDPSSHRVIVVPHKLAVFPFTGYNTSKYKCT